MYVIKKRVSIGEHNSRPLPNNYCKNNVMGILEILRIAIRSAIGYMSSNGFKCSRFTTRGIYIFSQ